MTDRMTLEPMNMAVDYPGDIDVDESEWLIGDGWMGAFADPDWDRMDTDEFLAIEGDLGITHVGFDSDDYGY